MPGSELIQSVVRAAEIIRLVVDEPQGLGVSELAQRLGLKPPTVHHLVRTLAQTGILEKVANPIRYRIGPVIRAASAGGAGRQLHPVAMEVMRAIAADLPQANVILAEFINNDVAVTLRMSADQPDVVQSPSHQGLSPYGSASTLLHQALWPVATRQAYRARYPFEEYGRGWADIEAVDDYLAQVAVESLAVRLSPNQMRLAAAAPVRAADGRLLATIGASLASQTGKIPASLRSRLVARVRKAATQISQAMQ